MKNNSITLKPISFLRKNLGKIALTAFLFGSSLNTNAQVIHKEERFLGDYRWKLGLSMNMMDMNFNSDKTPDGAKTLMNAVPSKLTLGYEFFPNLSIEAGLSLNKIQAGNYANDQLVLDDKNITTFDGSLVYSLGGLFNLPIVDPYVKAGIGYLGFGDRNYTSGSIGGGINFWIADIGSLRDYRYSREKWYRRLGVNVEAIGRKNLTNTTAQGSHAQFSAGIFYTF